MFSRLSQLQQHRRKRKRRKRQKKRNRDPRLVKLDWSSHWTVRCFLFAPSVKLHILKSKLNSSLIGAIYNFVLNFFREILDQHMIGHQNMERRFVCEICNAALKRKDHLTRHKQSHNPERPYLCHCLKAFKRKEQLSLHAVIHSGHKKHSCVECGKGLHWF